MMNKLKNRRCGLIRIWTEIHRGWVDLNVRLCLGFSIVVVRCVTVKTSLLIQRCKTILEDASDTLFNYKSSQAGNCKRLICLLSISYDFKRNPPGHFSFRYLNDSNSLVSNDNSLPSVTTLNPF